jgi:hypothetical protein
MEAVAAAIARNGIDPARR